MIWKLLRKNISIGQIVGYAIANLAGLAIIMSAICFYGDVKQIFDNDSKNSVIDNDFIVLSREVSILNTLGVEKNAKITPDDIRQIEAQPWVEKVGPFTSANFNVAASVDFQGRGMHTYMFLEAVPDEFIDNKPYGWKYSPGDEVPIMISKEYLALYNFGFATSRGMPQFTEGLISQVPITLYISGNGKAEAFNARIVGFSSRLNTIAVPQQFMDWANARFAPSQSSDPSRVIVEVKKPGDPAIQEFVNDNGYDIAGENANTGKISFLLSLLTSIVVTIGAVICLLALFILFLSITLLLQKNKEKNQGLMLLGYSCKQIASKYICLVAIVNMAVFLISTALMAIAASLWRNPLSDLGIASSSYAAPIAFGFIIILAITIVNSMIIAYQVK